MTVPAQAPNTPGYCIRGFPVGERFFGGASFCWAKLYTLTLDELATIVRDSKLMLLGAPLEVERYEWVIVAASVSQFAWDTVPGAGGLRASTLAEVYAALEAQDLSATRSDGGSFTAFDEWAREKWLANTMIRPVIGVQRSAGPGGIDLCDGLPCLAAAKHYGARDVYAIVGCPRKVG